MNKWWGKQGSDMHYAYLQMNLWKRRTCRQKKMGRRRQERTRKHPKREISGTCTRMRMGFWNKIKTAESPDPGNIGSRKFPSKFGPDRFTWRTSGCKYAWKARKDKNYQAPDSATLSLNYPLQLIRCTIVLFSFPSHNLYVLNFYESARKVFL